MHHILCALGLKQAFAPGPWTGLRLGKKHRLDPPTPLLGVLGSPPLEKFPSELLVKVVMEFLAIFLC